MADASPAQITTMPNLPSSNAPEPGSTGSSVYAREVSHAKVVEGGLDLSQSEIKWLDLGLDTPLPLPTALIPHNASQSRLPCPPNVQKYASPSNGLHSESG